MLEPQASWKARLGACQGLGRGAAERGESTQAFRELDPRVSHFTGGGRAKHASGTRKRKRKWKGREFVKAASVNSEHLHTTQQRECSQKESTWEGAGKAETERASCRQRFRHGHETGRQTETKAYTGSGEKENSRKRQAEAKGQREEQRGREKSREVDTGPGTKKEKLKGTEETERETEKQTERAGERARTRTTCSRRAMV